MRVQSTLLCHLIFTSMYIEKWANLVMASHRGGSHHTLSHTLKESKKHWTTNLHDHDIANAYVKALID